MKIKSAIIIFLLIFCVAFPVKANNDLIMEVIEGCSIQHGGDVCEAELKITNNTGTIIDGSATLHITYQGICSNNELIDFDGVGLESWYNDLPSSGGWNEGRLIFGGIRINEGENTSSLKISTVQNLCPGKYNIELGLTGNAGTIIPPIPIGGSGGGMIFRLNVIAQTVNTNNDNKIDILDFNTLMVNWGNAGADNIADFDNNGQVDIFDFNLLMIHWTG